MQLIDGKKISGEIKLEIAREVGQLVASGKKRPHLAAVLVGHDGGSETYVANKVKSCAEVGFESTLIRFEDNVSEKELLDKVEELNNNDDIDGFIVQLPLPKHISENKVIDAIDFKKDVDGFHPINTGRLLKGMPCFVSATPYGIMELLKRYNIETSGKHCVVLGRSNIVGRPISVLMSLKTNPGDATVTVCHSATRDIFAHTRRADVVVTALGKSEFLRGENIKEGAVVIDVGINRVEDSTAEKGYRVVGDCHFESCAPKASWITPVPGGVGPMTIAMLLTNTVMAAKLQAS